MEGKGREGKGGSGEGRGGDFSAGGYPVNFPKKALTDIIMECRSTIILIS
jgi:hypothetical protein